MDKNTNAITAAIDLLGGGSTGVKRVGVLLDLTTQRVYQLAKRGVCRKAEHAKILAEATGIPFETLMIRDAWKPATPPDDDGNGSREPGEVIPFPPAQAASTPGDAAHSPSASLGRRVGCVVRPMRDSAASARAYTPTAEWLFPEAEQEDSPLQRAA